MKIKVTKDAKKFINMAEMPEVKKIISGLQEEPIEEYAQIAACVASGGNYPFEILLSEAEISKNYRISNCYSKNSGKLDVWMRFYFYNSTFGFYEVGVYLTDLWQVTGENSEDIRQCMYIKEFNSLRRA